MYRIQLALIFFEPFKLDKNCDLYSHLSKTNQIFSHSAVNKKKNSWTTQQHRTKHTFYYMMLDFEEISVKLSNFVMWQFFLYEQFQLEPISMTQV